MEGHLHLIGVTPAKFENLKRAIGERLADIDYEYLEPEKCCTISGTFDEISIVIEVLKQS